MKNENMKKSLIKERDVIITTVSAKKKNLIQYKKEGKIKG